MIKDTKMLLAGIIIVYTLFLHNNAFIYSKIKCNNSLRLSVGSGEI